MTKQDKAHPRSFPTEKDMVGVKRKDQDHAINFESRVLVVKTPCQGPFMSRDPHMSTGSLREGGSRGEGTRAPYRREM